METNEPAGTPPAVYTDTQMLDWLLPFLDDSDIENSIDREARLQGALQAGLKGRAALQAAMNAVLVERDSPEAIQASRDRAHEQDVAAVKALLLDTDNSVAYAAEMFGLEEDNIRKLIDDADIALCDACGHWCYRAVLAHDDNGSRCLTCSCGTGS